jgi:ATP-dependent Zn protease
LKRYSGYTRSWELLQQHRDKLQSLAETLADRTELDRAEIASILG